MVNIIEIKRTPIRKRYGCLQSISTAKLLSFPLQEIVKDVPFDIDQLIVGNVIGANQGQNLAKQAALCAGLSHSTICTSVNKVCASSIKALEMGVNSILVGKCNSVLIGGVESMSQMPEYTESGDALIRDGLTCAFTKKLMGEIADNVAKQYDITRDELDEYSFSSYEKFNESLNTDKFKSSIVPVPVHVDNEIEEILVEEDERFKYDYEKMKSLKPVFSSQGLHTVASSSKLADGACALLLVSDHYVEKYNLGVMAKIKTSQDYENDPENFITAPVNCIQKCLDTIHLETNDMDLFEINEAFAIVPLLVSKLLHIDVDKINVSGGAIAFGHPLGASGLIILSHLISNLQRHGKKTGCLAICNGGGGASGLVVEIIA